jgi:disulfide bond formation protein DsbB
MIKFKKETILYFVFSLSILSLLAAYFIQYILGYQPCNLCLIERIPYILAIFIVSLVIFFKKFEKFAFAILSIIFFLAVIVSSYHFAIEQGYINESIICDLGSNSKNITKEAILEELKQKKISCKDVTFKIIGLSLTTLNLAVSLILSIAMFKNFLSYGKNR